MSYDVLEQDAIVKEIHIGQHGFVKLIDCMPRIVPDGETADFRIAEAARMSYNQKKSSENSTLIRYLIRQHHSSPLEFCEVAFHMAMPIFVARQMIRHRTANVNEISFRYTTPEEEFYIPPAEDIGFQAKSNKQGREGVVDSTLAHDFRAWLAVSNKEAYNKYREYLESGVTRELARIGLPLNVMTQWYWKCDLNNLLKFLLLRMDPHAQKEIRVYADAVHKIVTPIFPITIKAFEDYQLNAMSLTALEIAALKDGTPLATDNKRELAEWEVKQQRLGLSSGNQDAQVD